MVRSQNDQCDQGGQCELFVCNVASEVEVESVFAAIKGRFGVLHGLINCAGILRDGMLIKVKEGELVEKMTLAQWQSVIDVNLTGTFLCGREGAALMAQGGRGALSSISPPSPAPAILARATMPPARRGLLRWW